MFDQPGSAHHARNTARLAVRRFDRVLEKATRGGRAVAGPQVGPGPAMRIGLASGGAGLAARIGRRLERAIVAADAVDGIFKIAQRRLDDAGAAHAGDTAVRLGAGYDVMLEPAHG